MAEILAAPPPPAPRPLPPCAECGAPVRGAFCAACGQRAEALQQPVHHVVRDSFVEFFGLDGRVWRTFAALLFRPGRLTRAYMGGQRQRYLRPLRVYLTSTLLFFFVLSLLDPAGAIRDNAAVAAPDTMMTVRTRLADVTRALAEPPSARDVSIDSIYAGLDVARAAYRRDSLRLAAGPADAQQRRTAAYKQTTDSAFGALGALRVSGTITPNGRRIVRLRLAVERGILAALPPDSLVRTAPITRAAASILPDTLTMTVAGWVPQSDLLVRFRRAADETERMQVVSEGVAAAIGRVPTVMFLLLPLFALLLKGLYARRGWFFSEHVVFGLHTHAFAFVAFTALAVVLYLDAVDGFGAGSMASVWLAVPLAASVPLYVVLAMKRVYGQGWLRTLAKAALLGGAYTVVLLSGLAATLVLAAVVG